MIESIHLETDNVIGFRISGKIDTRDFDRIAGIIEEKLKVHDKLRVYAEVEHLEGMSLEAFFKDLRFSLRHVKDFDKEAVVSDRDWLRRLVNISDKLFPSVEVRHFTFAEKDQALDWIQR